MELAYKPDLEAVADRWETFWRGESRRPLISAVIPKAGKVPAEKPGYASGVDGNFTPVIEQLLRWAETHEFLAEAIPFYYLEFAADHFAALLGADLIFRDNEPGGWAVPFVQDLDAAEIRFRTEGKWWRRTVEFAEALREQCDGAVMLAAPTLVGNLDALAAIHGAQNVLMAMVDRPAAVHRALRQISQAHEEVLRALADVLGYSRYGSINRHGMYSRGRINLPQCDFSCMISPAMFREFAVPYLREEMRRLDGVEYHLDGPGALRHLDALCAIDELDVVQWVAGSGPGEMEDWAWLYQRIDNLGKGQIRNGNARQLRQIQRESHSRKLFFCLSASSRAEVEDCLAEWDR
jgi:5-methyltetrahydrofolate--homocysteine methyltransferase